MSTPDLVKRMADQTNATFQAPRRVTLPMVVIIALVAGAASWGATYALLNNQVVQSADAIKALDRDLQPRVRSLEDDNRDQKLILAYLQSSSAATSGALDSSRKDLSDRLSAIQNQLTALTTKVDLIGAASAMALPGDKKSRP